MTVTKALAAVSALAIMASGTAIAQVSGEGGPIRVNADRSEVLDKERKVILIDNVDIRARPACARTL